MFDSNKEYTLVLVKPDGYARGLTGEILRRIEAKGYTLAQLRVYDPDRKIIEAHYEEHADKHFYQDLVSYMMEGPVVAAVVEGANCISGVRQLTGATKPADALPGSIRGDFARDCYDSQSVKNVIHASDSRASAEHEIHIWFPGFQG